MARFYIFILLFLICLSLNAQRIINSDNLKNKNYLTFEFSQTNKITDNYYQPFQDSLLFVKYNGGYIPVKPEPEPVMYIFKSYFILDNINENQDISVFIGTVSFPCYIFINGQKIGRIGSFKEKYTPLNFQYKEYLLPTKNLYYNKDSINEICVQGYPQNNEDMPLDKIFIADYSTVSTYTFWRNFIGIHLAQLSIFISFILFLYNIFSYVLKPDRENRKYLFFGFFCFFFSAAAFLQSFSWDTVNQLIVVKITRGGMTMANLFLLFFTITFTGIFDNKKYLKYLLTFPPIIFLTIILSQTTVNQVEKNFELFAGTINLPYLIFAFVLSIISAYKTKTLNNIVFSLGFGLFLTTITIDTINYTNHTIPYCWIIPHGYSIFVITIFFILAMEQSIIYHLSIKRAIELEFIKKNLEQIVEDRTAEIKNQKEELLVQAQDLKNANITLNERNEEINQQNEEINAIAENLKNMNDQMSKINNQLTSVNQEITEKNKKITNSIEYALKIQKAVLPSQEFIKMLFTNYFIIYKPRDIVSGDFYLIKQIKQYTIIAVADCTGHGVPGAFMSMLGIAFLNEIIRNAEITSSAQVLNELREQIKKSLKQTGAIGEQHDGMDIAFCTIDLETLELNYAGAHLPCWIFRNSNQFYELRAESMPVGVYLKERPFINHYFNLADGDSIYLFTDGYYSQFGGQKNLPMKSVLFKSIITKITDLPMPEQNIILENQFAEWKQNNIQTDDVLIVGIKI